jgi:hypothetical protein
MNDNFALFGGVDVTRKQALKVVLSLWILSNLRMSCMKARWRRATAITYRMFWRDQPGLQSYVSEGGGTRHTKKSNPQYWKCNTIDYGGYACWWSSTWGTRDGPSASPIVQTSFKPLHAARTCSIDSPPQEETRSSSKSLFKLWNGPFTENVPWK